MRQSALMRTMLRSPIGAERAADALRILGALSIVVAGIGWGPLAAATAALGSFGTLFPRLLGLRPSVDITFAVAALVAAWSSVLDIYLTVRWWDIPMHLITNGMIAALAYLLLVRLGLVADAAELSHPVASAVVLTTALGIALGVVWEIAEFLGHTFIDANIYVGYADTIGDLAVDAAGALIAGFAMPYIAARSRFAVSTASVTR
ncbi:hypothetical protein WDJ51_08800 [Rathayibacter sp. YIM 133350]|uniref:hypothetical protein n=1 Tax=Rathayibacter sp. YIM 133350 TaxID=3131992 RepID=UPI00307D4AE8